ncbi:glycosyltransferase [Dyadobacter pollutisoli]|jgi:glycosyltransferase involved in cell wall biosynthesis|uniref:Glycosyltransferase n=1 Tax=Dyadobacter pollutisoli TaxID=2910158 RepID=A0A9E8NAT5_9BACT|nr:glycosyltransferase [Dyadobacter pollutisoli]WAC11923.1 glycosyltransferase [Dyadobacter pollutisoli]
MKKNVVVYGLAIGSYRTQNLIKALLETKEINTFFFNYEQFWRKTSPFFTAYLFFTEFMVVLKSHIVIFPAMRHQFTFRYKLAKLLGKQIITDFYVSFYDSQVIDAKTIDSNSKEAQKHFERDLKAILLSDCVIFLNEAEAAYYTSLVKVNLSDIHYKIVPLCVDNRELAYNKYAQSAKAKFTICWWGTYITLHGLDKILDAAKILFDEGVDFELYLFGESEEKAIPYKNKIRDLGIEKVVTINNSKSFNNGKLEPFLIQNCDLALGVFGDSSKARTVFTNKIADAFAMGLPVLSSHSTAMEDLLSKDQSEIIICGNQPKDIAEAIIALEGDRAKLLAIGKSARRRFDTTFSYKVFKNKISSILTSPLWQSP